jgi:hypothetical protein
MQIFFESSGDEIGESMQKRRLRQMADRLNGRPDERCAATMGSSAQQIVANCMPDNAQMGQMHAL